MAQAQIKTQKIIGGNLTTGQTSVAVLGSTASGSTVYTLDVDTQQNAQWLNGINDNVIVQNPNPTSVTDYNPLTTYSVNQYAKDPMTQLVYISLINNNLGNPFANASAWKNVNYKFFPYQETINSIGNVLSNNVAAIQQEGFLPYLSTTTYNQFALVKKPGTAEIYQSQIPNNLGNPLNDTASWILLVDLANVQTKALPLLGNQDCNVLGLNGAYGTFGVGSGAASTLANAPSAPEIFTTLPAGIFINQKIPYNLGGDYYIQQFYIVNFPQTTPQIIFRRFYYSAGNLWDGWETSYQSLGSILNGTDLNIAVNNGVYAIQSGTTSSLVNLPAGIASGRWTLSCERVYDKTTNPNVLYIKQTLTSMDSEPQQYQRTNPGNTTSSWNPWYSILASVATQSQILEGINNTSYVTSQGLAQSRAVLGLYISLQPTVSLPSSSTAILPFVYNNLQSTFNYSPFFVLPTNANNYITTILNSGLYRITLNMEVSSSVDNELCDIVIIRNGTIYLSPFRLRTGSLVAGISNANGSYVITWNFSANDTIQIRGSSAFGGGIVASPTFNGAAIQFGSIEFLSPVN